jgi:hypothetical protein
MLAPLYFVYLCPFFIHGFRDAALDGIPISRKPMSVIEQGGANAAAARWPREGQVGKHSRAVGGQPSTL